ncbi:hypothetical protein ACJ8LH_01420 [Serratia sp. CY49633]|uniref:hypothetical protein n=1 Tax=Serratia sp. CY49633 TaxID=3383629 RepID=UPI003F9FB2F2
MISGRELFAEISNEAISEDGEAVGYFVKNSRMELLERLLTAPPAPANAVAWEMRYWNSGYNCWHDWERITAEQHAEMSVKFATDNDYEFRVLYDAPPAPVVPEEISSSIRHLKDTLVACNRFNYCADAVNRVEDACRAAMLAQPVSGGYKLVPAEATEDMIAAAMNCDDVSFNADETFCVNFGNIYAAMLAAAPEGGN